MPTRAARRRAASSGAGRGTTATARTWCRRRWSTAAGSRPGRVERDHGDVGLAGAGGGEQVVDVDAALEHDHARRRASSSSSAGDSHAAPAARTRTTTTPSAPADDGERRVVGRAASSREEAGWRPRRRPRARAAACPWRPNALVERRGASTTVTPSSTGPAQPAAPAAAARGGHAGRRRRRDPAPTAAGTWSASTATGTWQQRRSSPAGPTAARGSSSPAPTPRSELRGRRAAASSAAK